MNRLGNPKIRNGEPITMKTVLTLLVFAGLLASTSAAEPVKPNIVYILADDLGYGDVQCLNPKRGKIATPNLDKMASQGMTFTDSHSGSSVCTPTRYGILTGRYAWRSRLQSGVLEDNRPPLIVDGRLTVAALLKQHGYFTSCLGKWHMGFSLEGVSQEKLKPTGAPLESVTKNGPLTRGFDEFFGFDRLTAAPTSMFEKDRCTQLIKPVDLLPAIVKRANATIADRSKTGTPFFLYLPLNSPHTPIVPSQEWQGKSGLGDYGDFVMETDWAVGEVLAALDKAGVAEKTLVIFTSDNGCSRAAGIPKFEAKGHYPSADLRGSKADIFDGGHRVPFFVRWPGKVKAGSHSSQLICHTDLMATCAEILGAKLPDNAGEDSFSILPVLLGTDKAPVHETVVHHSINGSFAIRQGNWKLELCADSGGWSDPKPGSKEARGLPKDQLYDLSTDKAESKNPHAENPEEVTRLTKLLNEIIANGRSTPGKKQANEVEIQIRKKAGKATQEETLNPLAASAIADVPVKHGFLATGSETFIVDADGKTTWRYPHASRDGWVLENGNILLALSKSKTYPGGAIVEVNRDGKVLFEFKGTQAEVNTVQALGEGKVLLTEAGNKPRILEVDRAGKVLVEIPIQAQTKDHHLQTRMTRRDEWVGGKAKSGARATFQTHASGDATWVTN